MFLSKFAYAIPCYTTNDENKVLGVQSPDSHFLSFGLNMTVTNQQVNDINSIIIPTFHVQLFKEMPYQTKTNVAGIWTRKLAAMYHHEQPSTRSPVDTATGCFSRPAILLLSRSLTTMIISETTQRIPAVDPIKPGIRIKFLSSS